eukprot:TRINITY_DN2060_c0_g1_i1.p1 TRINITY_DN2060_c0_g1~~TRINITY_DN2060_c0_g1_i1.p1  ORF type:complete len:602 (+),score=111.14 TRINITY_DN2060_c0_g1_i1:74-1879(+)
MAFNMAPMGGMQMSPDPSMPSMHMAGGFQPMGGMMSGGQMTAPQMGGPQMGGMMGGGQDGWGANGPQMNSQHMGAPGSMEPPQMGGGHIPGQYMGGQQFDGSQMGGQTHGGSQMDGGHIGAPPQMGNFQMGGSQVGSSFDGSFSNGPQMGASPMGDMTGPAASGSQMAGDQMTNTSFQTQWQDMGAPQMGGSQMGSSQASAPQNTRQLSPFAVTGVVEWWQQGSGQLRTDTAIDAESLAALGMDPNVFPPMQQGAPVHFSREDLVIAPGSSPDLLTGMQLQFRIFHTPGGPQAAEVCALGGEPIQVNSGKGKGGDFSGKGGFDGDSGKGWNSGFDGGGYGKGKSKGGAFGAGPYGKGGDSSGGSIKLSMVKPDPSQTFAQQAGQFGGDKGFGKSFDKGFGKSFDKGKGGKGFDKGKGDKGPARATPCRFWQEGRCMKGDACQFKHEGVPGAAGPPILEQGGFPSAPGGRYDRKARVPCRFFFNKGCDKAEGCPFSHAAETLQAKSLEQKVEIECTYHLMGKCYAGAACDFAHGPEEVEAIKIAKQMVASGQIPISSSGHEQQVDGGAGPKPFIDMEQIQEQQQLQAMEMLAHQQLQSAASR